MRMVPWVFVNCWLMAGEGMAVGNAADRPEALMRLSDPRWDGRMVCAHRGDRQAGPDNSAVAIEAAIPVADTIEIDLRPSRDGVYFCFHDSTLTQSNCVVPDASWHGRPLGSLTAAELRHVRLSGSKAAPLLSYAEALAIAKKNRACLQLDLKTESNATVDAVVRQAAETGMDRSIIIQCQLPSTLAYVRKTYPQVATLARCRSVAMVRVALDLKPTIVQGDDAWMKDDVRRLVRQSGAKLLDKAMGRDTDRPEGWQSLYAKGYHLLMTDKPRELRAWLKANVK